MNSNQLLLDRTLRHKILLLGFSKQVADEVIAYLKHTEPAIRQLLLEQFLTKAAGRRLVARLRQTEARLRALRKAAWQNGKKHIRQAMEDIAEGEPDTFERHAGTELARPEKDNFPIGLVSSTMIAGHTLQELLDQLEDNDTRRLVANLRVGVLAGEDVTKLMRRLTGRNAVALGPLRQQIEAVTASASSSIADAVRYEMVRANRALFDYEQWISILDRRTTQTCRKLHKKKFPVGEGPYPGYHIHCRSERIALSNSGGSARAEDYATWIAAQPEDFRRYAGTDFSFANLKPLGLDKVYNE